MANGRASIISRGKALVKRPMRAIRDLPVATAIRRYRAPGEIRQYLEQTPDPLLHLGCGEERFEGWLNADFNGAVFLDLTKPFPIPNATIAMIYHEHVIEHLELPQAKEMLAECFRVMRPGGVMRISCPDFQGLASVYLNDPKFFFDTPIFQEPTYARHRTALQRLCQMVYGFGHRWMWDFESMSAAVEEAGFIHPVRRTFRTSPHAKLQQLDRERRKVQSLYVECEKPTASGT